MKKIFVIINPKHIKQAKEALLSLEEGDFIFPCVFKIELPSEKVDLTVDCIDFLLENYSYDIAISTKVI